MRSSITEMIDLHGKTVKETKEILANSFRLAHEKNLTELYIITGRGNHVAANGQRGVLKKILPKLLSQYSTQFKEVLPAIGCYRVFLNSMMATDSHISPAASLELVTPFTESEEKEQFIHFLQEKASANQVAAIVLLANLHLISAADESEINTAISLFEKAISLGSLLAKIELADIYLNNNAVKPNYKKGVELLMDPEVKKHPLGQLHLGRCYLLGLGVKQNDETGKAYLISAAENGQVSAQFNLAMSYCNGDFTEQNDKQALMYFLMAAKQGHAKAKTYIARYYATGVAVPQDYVKAFHWYYEAAEDDDIFALYQLGHCYLSGRGVEQSISKACECFSRAALLGDADSAANLAEILIFSIETPLRRDEGISWLSMALAQKNALAYYVKFQLCELENKPKDEQRKYLELAAKAGHSQAQYEWAIELIMEFDNKREALAWLKKSAESNKVPAAAALQSIIDKSTDKEHAIKTKVNHMFLKVDDKDRAAIPHAFTHMDFTLFRESPLLQLLNKYKTARDLDVPNLETALRRASALGRTKDVKLLIAHGASIDAQDANPLSHRTALHWAVIENQLGTAQQLILAGAKMDIVDAKINTVLDYVKLSSSEAMKTLFKESLASKTETTAKPK